MSSSGFTTVHRYSYSCPTASMSSHRDENSLRFRRISEVSVWSGTTTSDGFLSSPTFTTNCGFGRAQIVLIQYTVFGELSVSTSRKLADGKNSIFWSTRNEAATSETIKWSTQDDGIFKAYNSRQHHTSFNHYVRQIYGIHIVQQYHVATSLGLGTDITKPQNEIVILHNVLIFHKF